MKNLLLAIVGGYIDGQLFLAGFLAIGASFPKADDFSKIALTAIFAIVLAGALLIIGRKMKGFIVGTVISLFFELLFVSTLFVCTLPAYGPRCF